MEYLIGGIIGFLIGLVIGIFLVCICVANGRDERVDMKLEPSKEFKTEMGCFITHDQAEEIDKLYLEKCKKLSEIEKVAKLQGITIKEEPFVNPTPFVEPTKILMNGGMESKEYAESLREKYNSCVKALKTIIEILED
ncbi:MAG: hypothetical protein KHW49_02795 [Eubacterium sp.]|jgi:hypothetical protein|nr:hypothetical protein [Eubacterium sp.]